MNPRISDRIAAIVIGILIFFIIIIIFSIIFTVWHPADKSWAGYIKDYNQVGDAVGGMASPLIGLISALLVFVSFREQIKANRLVIEVSRVDKVNDYIKDGLKKIESRFNEIQKSYADNGTSIQGRIRGVTNAVFRLNEAAAGIENVFQKKVKDLGDNEVVKFTDLSRYGGELTEAIGAMANLRDYFTYCADLNLFINRQIENTKVDSEVLRMHLSEYHYFMKRFDDCGKGFIHTFNSEAFPEYTFTKPYEELRRAFKVAMGKRTIHVYRDGSSETVLS